jgi:outer membrane protein assembly factor BamD
LMYMIFESSYQLAKNSVPEKKRERYQSTMDEYYSFVAEYPESEHQKDVDKMLRDTKEFLDIQ